MSSDSLFRYRNSFFSLVIPAVVVVLLLSSNHVEAVAQELSTPGRKALLDTLDKIAEAFENKKFAEATRHFHLPADFKPQMFENAVSRKIISRPGVEALRKGGEYGTALEIAKKSMVERIAGDFKVPLAQCFAIKMKQGTDDCLAIAHWAGTHFRILDMTRIGRMDPSKVVAKADVAVKPWPTGTAPTKELLIKTLQVFLHQIENKHYAATRPNVYVPDDFIMSRFHDSLERQEISAIGIKILVERGKFGNAVEVFGKARAESLTKRVQVPVAESYGYVAKVGVQQGEALAHWVGDRFKLLRADDIGKLPAALIAANNQDAIATPNLTPPKMTTPVPQSADPATSAAQPAASKQVVATPPVVAKLPKYETDKAVVMKNYPAMVKAVASNPNDVSLRAKFVQNLLVIGNTPAAWKEARAIHALAPTNAEVVYAIDQSIAALKTNGIFQVGVEKDTFAALMGQPLKEISDGESICWQYPLWNIDFNQGRFIKLTRTQPTSLAASVATMASTQKPKKPSVVVTSPKKVAALFDVRLTAFKTRISAVHLLRTEKDLSLKEAVKQASHLPAVVAEGITREKADEIKRRFAEKDVTTEIVLSKPTVQPLVEPKLKLVLSSFGVNKIAVIKVIRKLKKGISLRDAKQLVENTPAVVLVDITRKEGLASLELLKAAGASAELK